VIMKSEVRSQNERACLLNLLTLVQRDFQNIIPAKLVPAGFKRGAGIYVLFDISPAETQRMSFLVILCASASLREIIVYLGVSLLVESDLCHETAARARLSTSSAGTSLALPFRKSHTPFGFGNPQPEILFVRRRVQA